MISVAFRFGRELRRSGHPVRLLPKLTTQQGWGKRLRIPTFSKEFKAIHE
jgi:hypothetical protein